MTATATRVTPSAATRRDAVGVRLHTHGDLSPRWLDAHVLPLWESAHRGGRNLVLLRRGWVGGPHVDLVGAGPTTAAVDWVGLARTADAGPAPRVAIDPSAYLERARARGPLENVAPPYLPLREHGTALVLDTGIGRRPGPVSDLADLVTAVLAPALVRSLRTAADRPDGVPTQLVDILTCAAAAHTLGAGYGTFSLRSHAEALAARWSPGGQVREELARRHEAQRATVTARVAAVLDGRGGPDVAAWQNVLAYAHGVLDERVHRGELTNALVDAAGRAPAGRTDDRPSADAHPDTEFHNTVYGSGVTEQAGDWFAAYRMLVNCVYTQLPLLGVSPVQRAAGCWAVAHAVDDVLGQTWTERLASAHHEESLR